MASGVEFGYFPNMFMWEHHSRPAGGRPAVQLPAASYVAQVPKRYGDVLDADGTCYISGDVLDADVTCYISA